MLHVDDACQAFHDWYPVPTDDSPTYSMLAAAIGNDPELAGLLLAAPVEQRLTVLLFAAVQFVLFDEPDDPLARWYRTHGGVRTPDVELIGAFRRFVGRHRERILELLATRRVQTNEIGRCAVFLPAFARIATEVGGSLAHVDVGASAGLNLLLRHYGYRYQTASDGVLAVGVGVGTITLDARLRDDVADGVIPTPAGMPTISRSIGLDPAPIDLVDDDTTNWLRACVWPDQVDRFSRLSAAIELGRQVGVEVRRGDAVGGTAAVVREVAEAGHPVVTNSWVLNYLTSAERQAYVGVLAAVGGEFDLTWVWAEDESLCPELPGAVVREVAGPTKVVEVAWRHGAMRVTHLADAHPHGRWLRWLAR